MGMCVGEMVRFKPSEKTLLYVPMEEDFLDHGPLNIAITNNNSVALQKNVGGAKIAVGNFGDGSAIRYLSLNNSVNMQGAYTISVWAYHNAYASEYGNWYFVQGTNSDNKGLNTGVGLTTESRGLLMAFYGNDLDVGAFPTTGERHHFVFTYNGSGTKKIYQDGELKATHTAGNFTGTSLSACIGSRPRQTNVARFNGYMSELFIENYVWSLEEIVEYENLVKHLYGLS